MQSRGAVGAANDVREGERVAVVERHFAAKRGRTRLPSFWSDADVRRFLIAEHNFLSLDVARRMLVDKFGETRAPSRSAIGRFWQALDKFWGER